MDTWMDTLKAGETDQQMDKGMDGWMVTCIDHGQRHRQTYG